MARPLRTEYKGVFYHITSRGNDEGVCFAKSDYSRFKKKGRRYRCRFVLIQGPVFLHSARKEYLSYVKDGPNQGRRNELTGGGLIRSLGGWSEVTKLRLKGQVHTKSDERILGESDFVTDVLSQADEKYERQYELKCLGYDLNRIAVKVAEIFEMDTYDIFSKGKQQGKG